MYICEIIKGQMIFQFYFYNFNEQSRVVSHSCKWVKSAVTAEPQNFT